MVVRKDITKKNMINLILDILSFGVVLSSVLVITSKNPVIAVIFLISLFINTAGYLILMGIGFVGISYIIVYIGAITVLFLFIIMMINIRLLDLLEIGNEYTKNLPLAIIIGTLFTYEIFNILPFTSNNVLILNLPLEVLNYFNTIFLNLSNLNANLLNIFSNSSFIIDFNLKNFLQIEVLGHNLYTYEAILLIVLSFILLLAMYATIVISNKK